jgi:oligopeptide/dipeptide ABC transporter ATP-binding protein
MKFQKDVAWLASNMEDNVLVEVSDLKKHFPVKAGVFSRVKSFVKAVDGVSFAVGKGEVVGLVGESGCGKTTLGRAILRLVEPTAGEVLFKGRSILDLSKDKLRRIRRHMQIVFQDPYSSLNPRMIAREIVGEGLRIHRLAPYAERQERVENLLERVGIPSAYVDLYPHELSGGQRQRVAIARAIALAPSFVVCDEPVSALDVSIQSQVLNLLIELKEESRLSYLFISHDLSVVEYMSDRIMVMYLGQIVESASAEELYRNPKHPYTVALISAIPVAEPEPNQKRIILSGDPSSPINPPDGCRFHPRCPEVMDVCRSVSPEGMAASPSHIVKCHLYA